MTGRCDIVPCAMVMTSVVSQLRGRPPPNAWGWQDLSSVVPYRSGRRTWLHV